MPGHASRVHDHGGSASAVRVLHGELTESAFSVDAAGRAVRRSDVRFAAGAVTAGEGADVHKLANQAVDGTPLVTLHVYAPGLTAMRYFEERAAEETAIHA